MQLIDDICGWLRGNLGRCLDRWSHDWQYADEHRHLRGEVNDQRHCKVCGCRQVCVGHYAFMDADPMQQWMELFPEEISENQTDGRTGS